MLHASVRRVLAMFQPATDPVTGDHLSAGEHVSWQVQHVMRRWAFLGAITLATVVCWATRNDGVLTWWNLGASYAALLIEGITAMALINQCLRDAVVSRQTRALSERVEKMEVEHGKLLLAIHASTCGDKQQAKTPTKRRAVAKTEHS